MQIFNLISALCNARYGIGCILICIIVVSFLILRGQVLRLRLNRYIEKQSASEGRRPREFQLEGRSPYHCVSSSIV